MLNRTLMSAMAAAMLLPLCFSCSGGAPTDSQFVPAPVEGLSWPPQAEPQHMASDDVVDIEGSDFSEKGGTANDEGTDMLLTPADELNFAMYSTGGFSSELQFTNLTVVFSIEELEGGADTELYAALANYALGRWQFVKTTPGNWQFAIADPADYHSPTGNVYVALIHTGDGDITIDRLSFERTGETNAPPAPENLTGEQEVEQIDLDWDDVADADSYNVYRSLQPDFSNPQLVNVAPVLTSDFSDTTVATHKIYYYRVKAVRVDESGYSNQIDIFSPRADLPYPINVHFEDSSPLSVKIAWEWEGANPANWRLFFKSSKDFNLDAPIIEKQVPSFARSFTFNDVEPGEQIFVRVCARNDEGEMGRMIDDLPLLADELWQWGPVEEIETGDPPLQAIAVDGDISAAYISGSNVRFARRDNGNWSPETALGENAHTYFRYVDIAHGGGTYLISGYSKFTDDLWASTGTPGAWTMELVDGDDSDALIHPSEGDSAKVAATDTELAIVYQLGEQTSDVKTLALMTKTLPGGSWTREIIYDIEDVHTFNHHSVAYEGTDLFVLNSVPITAELVFASRSDAWSTWEDILEEGTGVRTVIDLKHIGANWYTPGYDAGDQELFVLNSSTTPWVAEQVSFNSLPAGRSAQMVNHDGVPVVAFYGETPDQWYFSIYADEQWNTQWVVIPDAAFTTCGDMVSLGGNLYLLYEDAADGLFKCAKGTPPA